MVKLFIPLLLIGLCIFSDLYIFLRYISPKPSTILKYAWWLPLLILLVMLTKFLFFNEGLEHEYNRTNIFLLLMGLFCIPKILFSILSFIPKVGEYLGIAVALAVIYIILYGITIGFSKLEVRHITFESSRVPAAFDGYKIVQFSDSHTGSFRGPYAHLLQQSIDTINAQHPDLVCFVGDIENFTPNELEPHRAAFSSIKAKDGVMTIMGNHDYSTYLRLPPREETAMVQRTRDMQRSFGWDMLENENRTIRRNGDSILVIGEENWGLPPFQQYGDIRKALGDITLTLDKDKRTPTLSLMLTHDPNAWRHHVMPVIVPDITLSGHTHGTQFSLFGWSPASMVSRMGWRVLP
ncbi:MAG: metallophosphoesterase family protein [Prevotella sp.]|nr:metallophosphoesterase family protein [Prevotella sp.]